MTFKIKIPNEISQQFEQTICEISYFTAETNEYMICFTNRKKIYYFDFAFLSLQNKTSEFQLIFDNFHNAWITGISVCIKKPFMITCSLDRWLNIWNYETSLMEFQKHYNEDLLSVCLHPNGLFVVLGTTSNLKYMSISINSLTTLHEFEVRSCSVCSFSNGGQLIACIHGTVIQIFSTVSYAETTTIKPKQVGKIKKLQFTKYDRYLICCSMTGLITILDMRSFAPVYEIVNKGISCMDIVLHPNQEWLYAISTDQTLRRYDIKYISEQKYVLNKAIEPILMEKIQNNNEEKLRCIVCNRSGTVLVVGTNHGYLKFYDIVENMKFLKQRRAHFSLITCISFTSNDEFLISSSLDGLVVFWSVNSKQKNKVISEQNEDVLINKSEYIEKLNEIKVGYENLNEVNLNMNLEFKIKELKFNEKLRALTKKFNSEMMVLRDHIKQQKDLELSSINECKIKMENTIEGYMAKIDEEKEILLNRNLFENEKIKTIEAQIKDVKFSIDHQVELDKIEAFKNITNFQMEKEEAIESKIGRHDEELRLQKEKLSSLIDYREKYLSEIETEQAVLKIKYKKQLCNLTKNNNQLKVESTLLRHQINVQDVYIEEYKTLFSNKESDIQESTKQIAVQEKLEDSLQKQILKNDKLAVDSEMRINDLILISLDLEKYNCVHKFTIDELHKQVDPIRNENSSLNKANSEILNEYQKHKIRLGNFRNSISSLKLKLKVFMKKSDGMKYKIEAKYGKCRFILQIINFIAEKYLYKTNLRPNFLLWVEKRFSNNKNLAIINNTKKLSRAVKHLFKTFAHQLNNDNEINHLKYKNNMQFYNSKNFIKSISQKRSFFESKIRHQKLFLKHNKNIHANRVKHFNRHKTTNEAEIQIEEKRIGYLETSIQTLEFAIDYANTHNIENIDHLDKILFEKNAAKFKLSSAKKDNDLSLNELNHFYETKIFEYRSDLLKIRNKIEAVLNRNGSFLLDDNDYILGIKDKKDSYTSL